MTATTIETLVIPSGEEQLSMVQKLQDRLDATVSLSTNRVCSECIEAYPTWASILEAPVEGGKMMGVLCCFQCCNYHAKLGNDVCVVKSPKMAADWTEEQVEALENSGNQTVNAVFEAKLKGMEEGAAKEVQKKQEENMDLYVQEKYQNRCYYSEEVYKIIFQKRRSRGMRKTRSSVSPKPPSFKVPHARSISLDESGDLTGLAPEHNASTSDAMDHRRDGLKKASSSRRLLKKSLSEKYVGIAEGLNNPTVTALDAMEHRCVGLKKASSSRHLLKKSLSEKYVGTGKGIDSLDDSAMDAMEHRRDGLKKAASSRHILEQALSDKHMSTREGIDNSNDVSSSTESLIDQDLSVVSDQSQNTQLLRVQRTSSARSTGSADSNLSKEKRSPLRRVHRTSSSKSESTAGQGLSASSEHNKHRNRVQRASSTRSEQRSPKRTSSRRRERHSGKGNEERRERVPSKSDVTSDESLEDPGLAVAKDIILNPNGENSQRKRVERSTSKRSPRRSNSDRHLERSLPVDFDESNEKGDPSNARPGLGKRSSSRRNLVSDDEVDNRKQGNRRGRHRSGRRGPASGGGGGGGGAPRRRAGSVGGIDMRRRGSLGTPVKSGASGSEDDAARATPTATTMERIAARRAPGRRRPRRRGSSGGLDPPRRLRGGGDDEFVEPKARRRSSLSDSAKARESAPSTEDLLLPSPEDLGYGADDDDPEGSDETKKKSKSWKKKLVALVKGPKDKSLCPEDPTTILSKAA